MHYYEDGNVQMKVEKELGTKIELKDNNDAPSIARAVIKAIDELETTFQKQRRDVPNV